MTAQSLLYDEANCVGVMLTIHRRSYPTVAQFLGGMVHVCPFTQLNLMDAEDRTRFLAERVPQTHHQPVDRLLREAVEQFRPELWQDVLGTRREPVAVRRAAQGRDERRGALPVEAARAVPIEDLFTRLGFDLVQRGRELATCCPFHDDRRPSLNVNAAKGLWYCFPCGIGGDGISLVMRLQRLDFAGAVREIVG